jgi:hypothetical protein
MSFEIRTTIFDVSVECSVQEVHEFVVVGLVLFKHPKHQIQVVNPTLFRDDASQYPVFAA